MSIWDDPEMMVNSDYVKFETIGDTVSGKVMAVQVHRFDDGNAAPKLILVTDDGEEKSLTAGQVRLKAALAEQRPEAGDHIKVTFVSELPAKKGKVKVFDVVVTRAGAAPAAPAAPPVAAATGGAPAQAAADPLAGFTPEQLAALAALQAAK